MAVLVIQASLSFYCNIDAVRSQQIVFNGSVIGYSIMQIRNLKKKVLVGLNRFHKTYQCRKTLQYLSFYRCSVVPPLKASIEARNGGHELRRLNAKASRRLLALTEPIPIDRLQTHFSSNDYWNSGETSPSSSWSLFPGGAIPRSTTQSAEDRHLVQTTRKTRCSQM